MIFPVTTIGVRAFWGCSNLKKVIVADIASWCDITIDSSESNPLYFAHHLYSDESTEITDLEIPEGVTHIRNFSYCTGLTSVSVPNSVTSIGNGAFVRCTGLTSIVVSEGNTVYDSRNDCNAIIKSSTNELIIGCKNTIIPNGVTSIGSGAFWGCSGLTAVTIPNSVTSIGNTAFYDCTGLTTISIPNSVTSIGDGAFMNCSNLTSVTINRVSPISINSLCFTNRANATLHVPYGCIAAYKAASYWKEFKEIIELPVLTFSDAKVKDICVANWDTNGDGELSEDEAAAVTELGEVFRNNKNITSFNELQYFTGLSSISNEAFNSCSNLTSVIIPSSVNNIGAGAFFGAGLTDINIPTSVTTIGESAFKHTALNSVSFPNSVTSVGNGIFYATNLTQPVYNSTIFAYMPQSYQGNYSIPTGINNISESSFADCASLTSVSVPNSVTSIDNLAFAGCTSLTSMTVELETPLSLYSNTFLFCSLNNATLYVPIGSKAAYEAANYWKEFGTIKEMSNDITIGSAGMGTFCSTHPLDFSGTDDIKAYIVSAFKPSTGEVTLTRITDVPANTGIVVKGNADTYTIPWGAGETVVANMLVGVTTNTLLNKVDGDYTNYILAKKNGSLGFYAVADGSSLSAGKAYLPLPTAQLPSAARPMKMIFSDDEATGIEQTVSNGEQRGDYYDLQGRRVAKPTHGLYIVNGKKVFFK